MCVDKKNNMYLRQLVTYRKIMCVYTGLLKCFFSTYADLIEFSWILDSP